MDPDPVDPAVTFDWTDAESPSAGVVAAVAAELDATQTSIRPLYGVVDPDALDALFDHRSDDERSVAFAYEGFDVVVASAGEGFLYERPKAPGAIDAGNEHVTEGAK